MTLSSWLPATIVSNGLSSSSLRYLRLTRSGQPTTFSNWAETHSTRLSSALRSPKSSAQTSYPPLCSNLRRQPHSVPPSSGVLASPRRSYRSLWARGTAYRSFASLAVARTRSDYGRSRRKLHGRTVFGINDHGADQRARPERQLEQRVRRHLADLRRVQPHGPYLIGGHSFGGVVAYEIARHLRDAGEDVALLVVLDTGAPNLPMSASAGFSEELRQLYPGQGVRARVRRTIRLAYFSSRRRALGWMVGTIRLDEDRRRAAYASINDSMLRRYRPQPYSGAVLLVRASASIPTDGPGSARSELGWGALLAGEVSVVDVEGDHRTIMREPYVGNVARALNAAFESLESRRPTDLSSAGERR